MRISVSEVPLEIRRKAAQHLETVRDTEMGIGAERAQLADEVCPIFRPDMEEIAYYEFEVDLQRSDSNRGFIIVSAAEHDFPIPHWSFDRQPISRQLEAAAEELSKRVARIFKLDALAYVGEDDGGEMAAQVGQIPIPFEGLPDDLEKARGKITSVMAQPQEELENDKDAEAVEHNVKRRGPRPRRLKFREVGSWNELKIGYGETFAPFLEDLRRRAAEAWQIDKLVTQYGEGILVGRPHRVALLEPKATTELLGEAADKMELNLIERRDVPAVLELSVKESRLEREANFELNIAYASGLQERLSFFAVSPDTPSNERSESGLSIFEEEK